VRGDDLTPAIIALQQLYARALERVRGHVVEAGRISSRLLDGISSPPRAGLLQAELEASRQLVAGASGWKSGGCQRARAADRELVRR
jgi:hypothetical protein